MKAISLWQPWASLMAIGAKKIETRSWQTSYRGPLAIHAAKKLVLPNDSKFLEAVKNLGLLEGELPLGAVVGVCDLFTCEQVKPGVKVLENPESPLRRSHARQVHVVYAQYAQTRNACPLPRKTGPLGLGRVNLPCSRRF